MTRTVAERALLGVWLAVVVAMLAGVLAACCDDPRVVGPWRPGLGATARPDRATTPPWQPVPIPDLCPDALTPEEKTREDVMKFLDNARTCWGLWQRAAELAGRLGGGGG